MSTAVDGGLRVARYGVRGAGIEFRGARYGLRGTGYELRVMGRVVRDWQFGFAKIVLVVVLVLETRNPQRESRNSEPETRNP